MMQFSSSTLTTAVIFSVIFTGIKSTQAQESKGMFYSNKLLEYFEKFFLSQGVSCFK
jgi:hypothetical protein